MKLSRVVTFVGLTIVTLAFWATVLNSNDAIASEAKLPQTPYKFEKIGETPATSVEIDKSTMFAKIDEDGDLLVGGVVQIQVKQTKEGPKTLIDAVVAICGYDGLVIVKGRTYNAQGTMEGETEKPLPTDASSPVSPAGMIYRFMCANAPTPVKPDPRYKAPERYTKYWT